MSPKTSCTIHTNHSLFVLFLFLFFFFLWMSTLMKKKKKKEKRFIIREFVFSLQQTTFRAPFSKERSRRHWVSVWCKTACFGWNTLPPLCSGTVPPRDWSGDGVCFIRFSLFFFFHLLAFGCVCRSSRPRCASSCEEPDGRTWRNICGHEEHLVSQTCLGGSRICNWQ